MNGRAGLHGRLEHLPADGLEEDVREVGLPHRHA